MSQLTKPSKHSLFAVFAVIALSVSACGSKEPTLEEFIAEFNSAAMEYERISAELNSQPALPAKTGNKEKDRAAIVQMLRDDAAKFDPMIERFDKMETPSDYPDAEKLRKLYHEVIVLMRDDSFKMADDVEANRMPDDPTLLASTVTDYMEQIADTADRLGMDSSEYRKWIDKIDQDLTK